MTFNKQWLVILLFGVLLLVGGVGTCTKYVGPIVPPEPIPRPSPAPGPLPAPGPQPAPNPNDVWQMLEPPGKNSVTGLELPAPMQVSGSKKFVIVAAKCNKQVHWLVSSRSGTPVEALESKLTNSILIFTTGKPKDTIVVLAYSAVNGQPTDTAITFITLSGNGPPTPKPNPDPTPTPTPTPEPAKYPAKLHVTFVLDQTKMTRAVSDVINSPDLRKWLADQGHQIHELSIDDIATYKLSDAIGDKVAPLLVLQAQGEAGIQDGWLLPGGVTQLYSVQDVKDAVLKATGKKE